MKNIVGKWFATINCQEVFCIISCEHTRKGHVRVTYHYSDYKCKSQEIQDDMPEAWKLAPTSLWMKLKKKGI
jgi:hypothetical protein